MVGFNFPEETKAMGKGNILTAWDTGIDKFDLGIRSTGVVVGRERTEEQKWRRCQ